MFKLEPMESIPPKENPFWHDTYHMGQRLGSNVMAMFENHDDEKMNYLIIINTETGERCRVVISPEMVYEAGPNETVTDLRDQG